MSHFDIGYNTSALDPSLYLALRARLEKYGDDVRRIDLVLEHSSSRFDLIRYANRFESFRLVKNRPFDSPVVMQFFLVYLLYIYNK